MEVEGMGGMEGDLEGMHGEEGVGQGLWELTWERPGQRVGAEQRGGTAWRWQELGAAVLEVSLLPECLPWNFPA